MVEQRTPGRLWRKMFAACTIAAAAIGMAGIAGCEEPPPFKHNAVNVLPLNSLQSAWFIDLKTKTDPLIKLDVRDKLVYASTEGKQVIAFDRKAGTRQFSMSVSTTDILLRPLVELKDHIVFPNATTLEVYDTKGIFEESISLMHPLRSDAAGENNTVYFGSVGPRGGLVEAYDILPPVPGPGGLPIAPASFKWEYLTQDATAVTAGLAAYSGIIYSASEGGEIDAVSPARAQSWDTENGDFLCAGAVAADLKTDEAGLYIASKDSKLYCLNRTTGKLKWQYFAGVPLDQAPVTTADTLYEYVPGQGLVAIDKILGPFNRTPRWVHPTATQFLAQDEKYAYLADPRPVYDGQPMTYAIIAVDKMTMHKAFESDHKDFTVFGTNHKDNLIYAGYADGKLFAIKPVVKGGQIGELVMAPLPVPGLANAD